MRGGHHKKLNQQNRVLEYIKQFGGITSFQAYTELGITQLAARVRNLEDDGYRFNRERVHTLNKFGEKVSFVNYTLKEGV